MDKMGIWLDHKKAVLVFLDGEKCKVEHVESDAENHYHHSGGWKSAGSNMAQSVVKESTAEERRHHQYHAFYKKIIGMCDNVGEMYIFGPSEAKLEFKKELDKIKVSHISVHDVEASDKLSEYAIVNKVKEHFHVPV